MGLRAGIDLGTTNSCIYVLVDGQKVVVRDEYKQPTFPSAVWKHQGKLEVGRKARQRVGHVPSPVLEVKRQMGTDGQVTLDGVAMSALEVSALILGHLKDVAEAFIQKHHPAFAAPISDVVVTHPAYFSGAAKADTEKAGIAAGFAKVDLLAEPVAAALAYTERADQAAGHAVDQRMLVFDLGGGTFDVTLLERQVAVGVVDVIAFGGNPFLGGSNFDACVAEHLRRALAANYAVHDLDDKVPTDNALLMKLRLHAEKIKIALSSTEVYETPVPDFALDRNGVSMSLDVALSRDEFNTMTRHLMDQALSLTHRLLAPQSLADGRKLSDAELDAMSMEDILARSRANAAHCDVMLAGSSTWMPVVKERLERELGRPARILAPDVIVAEGAAIRMAASNAATRVGGAGGVELVLDAPARHAQRRVPIKGEIVRGKPGMTVALNVLDSGEELPQILSEKQTFFFHVELQEEQANLFSVVLLDAQGTELLAHEFSIVHDPADPGPPPPPPDLLAMPITVQTAQGFRALFPVGARLPANATLPLRTPNESGQLRIPFYEGDQFQSEIVVQGAPRQANFQFELRATMDRSYRLEAEAVLPGAGQPAPKVEFAIKPRVLRQAKDIRAEWQRLALKLDDHLTDAPTSKRLSFRLRWAETETEFDRALSQRPPDIAHAEALAARARKLTDEAGAVVILKPPIHELEGEVEDILGRARKEEDRGALKAALARARKAWQDTDAKAYEDCVKAIDHVDSTIPRPPPPPQDVRNHDLAALQRRLESLEREGKMTAGLSSQIANARHQLEAASPDEVYAIHNRLVVPVFAGAGGGSGIALVQDGGTPG